MDDNKQNQISNSNLNTSQEEIDYLYALYKSSQAGSGAKLSKKELKFLVDNKLIKKNLTREERINNISNNLVILIYDKFKNQLKNIYKENWSNLTVSEQFALINFAFQKKYNKKISEIYQFIKNNTSKNLEN